jgi:adenine-specific DNA-methyltransferase
LLTRIITASSHPGDLVADFFCGSGAALAVAEKLGRRWIGCDLGQPAIQTARTRLLALPEHRAFDILDLGEASQIVEEQENSYDDNR